MSEEDQDPKRIKLDGNADASPSNDAHEQGKANGGGEEGKFDGDGDVHHDAKANRDGDIYFDLSTKKRVTIKSWHSAVLVDIREYYDRDGVYLPGRKGISLNLDQYKILRDLIVDGKMEEAISKKQSVGSSPRKI